jgi:SAM-dependent methyltransferase
VKLLRHKEEWNSLGRLDPFWAILSDPARRHGGWEPTDFFASGQAEIDALLSKVREFYPQLRMGRALDFGCGVGRLTRALGKHFEHCDGVDISEEMVRQARELNTGRANLAFHVNDDSLSMFGESTFDFIYSSIVLQHIPSRSLIKSYLSEFLRILRPGGMMVFQLPAYLPWESRLQVGARLYSRLLAWGVSEDVLYRRLNLQPIRMMWLPEQDVRSTVTARGGQALRVEKTELASGYVSAVYFVTKQDAGASVGRD